ncbi:MAG TPA: efflux RND transporter periplasmic adaptor subunit [bacterium]|nr:efflux RND transporter periplasmic adaptor subunit [bacterium]
MKQKKMLLLITLLVVLGALAAILSRRHTNGKTEYQFVEITRGNVQNTISSTGTIAPVSKVEVGTQVSGTIDRLYTDFNQVVHKGQLLAVLDTVLLKAAVLDAQANLEKVSAQLEQARADFERNQTVFEKKLISEAEYLPYKVNYAAQVANLKSAQANLVRAERNLKFAVIRSPIDGTVISRNVEAGQTVAASLQAPVLFIIAGNLTKMEIHAAVDESDIGSIRDGQTVQFQVPAYADKTFTGSVRQIRLQPETVQNVVNYTVVIDADNVDNLLLPGMTATLDFIVQDRQDVLLVPNAALNFKPTEAMLQQIRKNREAAAAGMPDSLRGRMRWNEGGGNAAGGSARSQGGGTGRSGGFAQENGAPGMPGGGFTRNGSMPKDMGRLYFLDEKGNLSMAMIQTGASDGKSTEIVRGRRIKEGMKVISGLVESGENKSRVQTTRTPAMGPGMGGRPF